MNGGSRGAAVAAPGGRRGEQAAEAVLGKAYDAKLMGRIWRFVSPYKKLLVLSILTMPVAVAFEVAQPYVVKVAIDRHIARGALAGLGTLTLLYVGLVLLQAITGYVQLWALQLLGQRSMNDLRMSVYRHVLAQRSAFFDRTPVGRLLTRMTSDIENINEMFASGVVTLLADVVKLVTIVGLMAYLNVRLTLILFFTFPLLFALVEYSRRLMRASFREIRVKLAAMNAFLQEHLSGLKVVQLFTRERAAAAEYDEINRAHRNAYVGAIRADAALYAVVDAIAVAAVACIAYYAAGRLGGPKLTVGLVVAFIEYINKFFIPVRDLSAKYTVMQSAMASAERIFVLLDANEPDAPVRTTQTKTPALPAESRTPAQTPVTPAIELHDVSFSYRPGEDVLRGVSLTVARGRTVAVVGATGSGKSTVVKLLARLYEPDSGKILLSGRDITELPASDVRRRITVVSQDIFLFQATVAENVGMGLDDITRDEIEAALVRVGADKILARRGAGAGADAAVAERGANFSAGERQLISFARALVRDPEILLLDEATAHIDPEAEATIERGLETLMAGRTSLVIAHRLSTIRRADHIVVMARGRIAEQGSHDELVAAGGLYARLEGSLLREQA